MEIRDKNGKTEAEFLASYDATRWERPSVTVDLLVYCVENSSILLIKRGNHPFLGKWALPGGFVEPNETTEQGAKRELFEETNVKAENISLIGCFSEPDRDPRTRIITVAYRTVLEKIPQTVAGDDAAKAEWFKLVMRTCRKTETDTQIITDALFTFEGEESFTLEFTKTQKKSMYPSDPEYKLDKQSPLACDHWKIIAKGMDF